MGPSILKSDYDRTAVAQETTHLYDLETAHTQVSTVKEEGMSPIFPRPKYIYNVHMHKNVYRVRKQLACLKYIRSFKVRNTQVDAWKHLLRAAYNIWKRCSLANMYTTTLCEHRQTDRFSWWEPVLGGGGGRAEWKFSSLLKLLIFKRITLNCMSDIKVPLYWHILTCI